MPHVDINDIVQPLQENHQYTPSDWDTRNDLRHPGDVRARSPCEPEEAYGKDEGAQDHGRETLFGDDSSMFLHLPSETCFGDSTTVEISKMT